MAVTQRRIAANYSLVWCGITALPVIAEWAPMVLLAACLFVSSVDPQSVAIEHTSSHAVIKAQYHERLKNC